MSEAKEEMKIDPARAQTLVSQLSAVRDRVTSAANGRNVSSLDLAEGKSGKNMSEELFTLIFTEIAGIAEQADDFPQ